MRVITVVKLAVLTLTVVCALLFVSLASGKPIIPSAETDISPYPGDSMDDAAVWRHPFDPDQSVIVTTAKASNLKPVMPIGLITYDLDGSQIEFFQDASPNNVDIRPEFPFDENNKGQLIAVSQWYSDQLGLYRIDPATRLLEKVASFPTNVEKLRGLCLGKFDDEFFAIVAGSEGMVEQYQIHSASRVELINQWQLESETEGCVISDQRRIAYIAEENLGIWSIPLQGQKAEPILLDEISWFGPLKRGLEGLSLIEVNTRDYLVVSVQEKSRFAIYDLATSQYLDTFHISSTDSIDGVSKTDGIHIEPLSTAQYPSGFMVVHDDRNLDSEGNEVFQNFKIVRLESLIEFISQLSSKP